MAKAPRSKSQIAFVCLGLLVLITWLGWFYLQAMGRAYSNGAPGPGSVGYVLVAVSFMSLVFAGLGLFQRGSLARVYALAPIVLVVLGEVLVQTLFAAAQSERASVRAARSAAVAAHVATLPQTYVHLTEEDGSASFLFVDERTGFLMLVNHGGGSFDTSCLGSILDGALSLEEDIEPRPGDESILSEFVDERGRSPVDDYELAYVERLNQLLCDYERYDFR